MQDDSMNAWQEGVLEKNKLFIGNLDRNVRRSTLKEFFTEFGEVAFAKVLTKQLDDGRRVSRGIGFVTFVNEADAEKALNECNGKVLDWNNGRELRIDFARPQAPRPEGEEGMAPRAPRRYNESNDNE